MGEHIHITRIKLITLFGEMGAFILYIDDKVKTTKQYNKSDPVLEQKLTGFNFTYWKLDHWQQAKIKIKMDYFEHNKRWYSDMELKWAIIFTYIFYCNKDKDA